MFRYLQLHHLVDNRCHLRPLMELQLHPVVDHRHQLHLSSHAEMQMKDTTNM